MVSMAYNSINNVNFALYYTFSSRFYNLFLHFDKHQSNFDLNLLLLFNEDTKD